MTTSASCSRPKAIHDSAVASDTTATLARPRARAFMAFLIGTIACVQGMAVEGSAESLGQHTTDSVVHSIFFVIVLDGLFAVFFASIGM